ncbi:hypothetical protein niasHT_008390 [Heterodera trifolii]|uniref:Uncharacterized protein n=1 Tax=Heterodera trifolii TaxID=157864 RepID=A0ABD2LTE0_9BILA
MFAKIFQLEILFLILRLDYSKANAVDDVGQFITAFSAVTDSCTDVLDRLGKISKGALNVVKLAGPLGQLIHTADLLRKKVAAAGGENDSSKVPIVLIGHLDPEQTKTLTKAGIPIGLEKLA